MNYSSQLKGWAVDRATTLKAVNKEGGTVQDILDAATKLMEYCYSKDEDRADLMDRLAELDHNDATAAAIAMKPASNADQKRPALKGRK